jgi:hypothetical protein
MMKAIKNICTKSDFHQSKIMARKKFKINLYLPLPVSPTSLLYNKFNHYKLMFHNAFARSSHTPPAMTSPRELKPG